MSTFESEFEPSGLEYEPIELTRATYSSRSDPNWEGDTTYVVQKHHSITSDLQPTEWEDEVAKERRRR